MFINSIFALTLLAIFQGAAAVGPTAVKLGTAGGFAVLAQSGISTVPSSAITGNIGVSPAAGTALTGFSLTREGPFSSSLQVVGELFASDYGTPTPANLLAAVSGMQTAFTDASGRLNPNFLNVGAGSLSGLTLAPGLYKWTTSVIVPTSFTISGGPLDTWIFQIAGGLSMAGAARITLAGGALASNIVWAVSGTTTIGATAHFEGILLGANAITFNTGSTANGRLLSQTAVVLQKATIVQPVV